MRSLFSTPISVFALAALSGGGVFAQSFTGTWQGALKIPQAPNSELRIVLKISTTASDKLAGEFYSIDQSGPASPPPLSPRAAPRLK
jgi:hypothetical protein